MLIPRMINNFLGFVQIFRDLCKNLKFLKFKFLKFFLFDIKIYIIMKFKRILELEKPYYVTPNFTR